MPAVFFGRIAIVLFKGTCKSKRGHSDPQGNLAHFEIGSLEQKGAVGHTDSHQIFGRIDPGTLGELFGKIGEIHVHMIADVADIDAVLIVGIHICDGVLNESGLILRHGDVRAFGGTGKDSVQI